jgi:hypothetical protein
MPWLETTLTLTLTLACDRWVTGVWVPSGQALSAACEEELRVKGLHSMQSVALRLNKKLELTSVPSLYPNTLPSVQPTPPASPAHSDGGVEVKRLMRLSKYKAFSPEELTHVSNGHITSVLEQVQRVREKLGDWPLGQNVFQIVEGSAELCLKVNDYAEAVNQDTHRKMHHSRQ